MWFKNLAIFRFSETFSLSAEALEQELGNLPFRPCGNMELTTSGWTSPRGRQSEQLVQSVGGFHMLCLQKEEKILPTSVINEQVAEKIAQIEDEQGRKPRKSEKDNIRDEIVSSLLPKAFTHRKRTFGYIDPANGWLIVDAASSKKAEEFTAILRKTLGTLAIAPPVTQERPIAVMTRWLTENDSPADITIENECELRAPDDEGGIVRCKRHDLFSEEIQNHLAAGKEVIKLLVSWDDRLNFVLDDSVAIKRLRFLDIVQEQAADIETQDENDQLDADFAIMSAELANFLPRLMDILGGENSQALVSPTAMAS